MIDLKKLSAYNFEMPIIANKSVYKEKEFNNYVLWKFLPAHARGMKKSELAAIGLNDPLVIKLIKIKNQTEFAKHFHIKDLGTLTDWNNKIKKESIAPPSLINEHHSQHASINGKIIIPNITELQQKIKELGLKISLLRRENTILKKRLESLPLENKSPINESTMPKIPETTLYKVEDGVTSGYGWCSDIMQKFLKYFKYL